MSWPDIELNDDLAQIARRLVFLSAQRADIDVEIADLRAKIRSTVNVGQRATIGGRAVVSVIPNRRFDVDMAKAKLPPDVVELCMTKTFDSRIAKMLISPADYEACMRIKGDPVVRTL